MSGSFENDKQMFVYFSFNVDNVLHTNITRQGRRIAQASQRRHIPKPGERQTV